MRLHNSIIPQRAYHQNQRDTIRIKYDGLGELSKEFYARNLATRRHPDRLAANYKMGGVNAKYLDLKTLKPQHFVPPVRRYEYEEMDAIHKQNRHECRDEHVVGDPAKVRFLSGEEHVLVAYRHSRTQHVSVRTRPPLTEIIRVCCGHPGLFSCSTTNYLLTV